MRRRRTSCALLSRSCGYVIVLAIVVSLAACAMLSLAVQAGRVPAPPFPKSSLRTIWDSELELGSRGADSRVAAVPAGRATMSAHPVTIAGSKRLQAPAAAPTPQQTNVVQFQNLSATAFPSCTHWNPSDSAVFAERANHARGLVHPSSSIPRQILLNFGLWSGFTLPVSASAEGADLSADPALAAALPPAQREVAECWLQTHPPPLWRVRLWDGPSSEAFMQRFYGSLLAPGGGWAAYRRKVQRSDLLRVLLVAHFGGLYVDLDVRPPARRSGGSSDGGPHPLDELWAAHPTAAALLFEENILSAGEAATAARTHAIRGGRPEECQRIANYMIAAAPVRLTVKEGPPLSGGGVMQRQDGSKPDHLQSPPVDAGAAALLKRLLQLMIERASLAVRTDYDVLYTSGPALLTEAVYAHAHAAAAGVAANVEGSADEGACELASDILEAAVSASTRQLTGANSGVVIVRRPEDQRYFDHMTAGTWRAAGDSGSTHISDRRH